MADAVTSDKPKIEQPSNPRKYDVERKGQTKVFSGGQADDPVSLTFTEARTTKGKNPGLVTFLPDTSDKQKFLDWVGLDNVFGIVKSKVSQLGRGWYKAAVDEESKQFNPLAFVKFAADFSSSGETIGELEDQMEDLREELLKIDMSKVENYPAIAELGKRMQDLTISINQRKRKPKAEDDDEETVAAAAA